MNGNNKNLLFVILAVIGGVVVLGWALRFAASFLGLIIFVALIIFAVVFVQKFLGKGR